MDYNMLVFGTIAVFTLRRYQTELQHKKRFLSLWCFQSSGYSWQGRSQEFFLRGEEEVRKIYLQIAISL